MNINIHHHYCNIRIANDVKVLYIPLVGCKSAVGRAIEVGTSCPMPMSSYSAVMTELGLLDLPV